MKTCSWWVTRGCNYRDVRGRVLSQSASARSVSEPPRKRGFAPAGRDFQPRFKQRVARSPRREEERRRRRRRRKRGEPPLGKKERLCICVNAMKTSVRKRVCAWRVLSGAGVAREARDVHRLFVCPPVCSRIVSSNRTNRSKQSPVCLWKGPRVSKRVSTIRVVSIS